MKEAKIKECCGNLKNYKIATQCKSNPDEDDNIIFDNDLEGDLFFKYCPHCGKKIVVIEKQR